MGKEKDTTKVTPMVKQYLEIKKDYKDTILFYRLGDFYEMFYDDAILCSKELELTLTSRNVGELTKIPMCGVPYHAAESYIAKLIKKGYKVAICEQVEDPKLAKKLVKREVVQIITPGTTVDFNVLNQKSNNYLMSLFLSNEYIGISFCDVSTGEFFVSREKLKNLNTFLENIITKFHPSEVLIPDALENKEIENLFNLYPEILINKYYDWVYDYAYARNKLLEHFKIQTLESFEIEDKKECISAASAIIHYLNETQKQVVNHLDRIRYYSETNYMILDNATVRNLELINNLQDNSTARTLFSILDNTSTPQGARLLKKRILAPLMNIDEIKIRLHIISIFFNDNDLTNETKKILTKIFDIERLASRISLFKANPRDLISLKESLKNVILLKEKISNIEGLNKIEINIDSLKKIIALIEKSIIDDPPVQLGKGAIIKEGFNEEYDKYKKAESEGKEWILKLQQEEIKKTGINSLKIKYNKVFGYYVEITKTNLNLVPDYYIRKQTLTNAERFTFPKLQEYEETILTASEKVIELEEILYKEILSDISKDIENIKKAARFSAEVDFFISLTESAIKNNYTKPDITTNDKIIIKNGRHPVVEKSVITEEFIPNDTEIDTDENRILIITGPNMAGKSTYLRQVALITLMAQIGSFIPAEKGEIGIVDRIFTRVGASDNLAKGESTFLVEMKETSNILNNATEKSLIVMDEIGRGTSTYDGLSIAWSVVEYINSKIKAKTLFATHYHELTELGRKRGIRNYNITVKEWGDKVIFLRKIKPGAADKSYGIQVAQLAGLPEEVIKRAKEILKDLEEDSLENVIISQSPLKEKDEEQMKLFSLQIINPAEKEIKNILEKVDINNITPLDALKILAKIKEKLK